MAASLLSSFASLDTTTKDLLADIDSPRGLALATLSIAKTRFDIATLSAEHIVAGLEAAGVAVTRKSIGRSLSNSKGLITRTIEEDGEVFYRLMTRGEREAEKILGQGGLTILRIEGGLPRQARLRLGEIFQTMKGTVKICDPYYGVSTLDSLDLLPKTCTVQFLTQKTNDSARKISSAFRDFYKERPKTEFRIAPAASRLHDRYIITNDQLLILGHGIKDIGNKESFVVALNKELIPDLMNEINSFFDGAWKGGTTVT